MENVEIRRYGGLKFCICSRGVWIESESGEVWTFENGREAVIRFIEKFSNPVYFSLLNLIEKYGYNRYTGEKKKEPREGFCS